MPSASYPFAVGRIRVIEQSLLSSEKIKRLADASREGFLKELNDIGFAAECPSRESVDELVKWREQQVRGILADVTPDAALTELFFLDIDAANLKLLLKAKKLGDDPVGYLQKGVFDPLLLRPCVESCDYSPLGEPLGRLVEQAALAPFDAAALSAAIDNAVYSEIFARLKRHRNGFCYEYFVLKVDCTNLLSALRAHKLGYSEEQFRRQLMAGGRLAAAVPDAVFAGAGRPELAALGVSEEMADAVTAADADSRIAALLERFAAGSKWDSFGIGPIVNFAVQALGECRTVMVLYARAGREEQK